MALRNYLAQRLLFFIFSFFIVLVLNFLIPRLLPGNPVTRFINPLMTPQIQHQILAQFGLTKPLYVQFLLYIEGVFTGNFGVSFLYYPVSVGTVMAQRLPWTIFLVGSSTIISTVVGIYLGLGSAWRAGSKADTVAVLSSMAFRSIPTFWLGLILLIVFGVTLRLLPTSGYFTANFSGTSSLASFVQNVVSHSILPIATLTAYLLGGNLLIMRAQSIETLREDFVFALRAEGYDSGRILRGHVLKNAFLPMLTNIGIQMGYIASGAVLVETVFSYPGMGLLVYQAVLARDYPTLQGSFFVLTVFVLVAVLISDLLYSVLDPRIRR
jgi:peptide/nickel transport system permease protein